MVSASQDAPIGASADAAIVTDPVNEMPSQLQTRVERFSACVRWVYRSYWLGRTLIVVPNSKRHVDRWLVIASSQNRRWTTVYDCVYLTAMETQFF